MPILRTYACETCAHMIEVTLRADEWDQPPPPCPQCAMPSFAIHSSYHRHPRDLPCIGRPIRLVFTVRKFFCRNPTCSRKVFAERLSDFIEASERLSPR